MRDGMKQTSIGTSRQIRPTKKQPSGANIEPGLFISFSLSFT